MILLLTQFIHVHVTWDPNISSITIFLVQRLGWFRYHSVFLVEEIITLPLTGCPNIQTRWWGDNFPILNPILFCIAAVAIRFELDLVPNMEIWFLGLQFRFYICKNFLMSTSCVLHYIAPWDIALNCGSYRTVQNGKRSRNPDRYRWIGWHLDRCDRVRCYWLLGLGLT